MKETRQAYFQGDFQTREEGENFYLEGYFVVYNRQTELWHNFFESVAAGACTKSILNNDIVALFNHNSDLVLGTAHNSTLTLTEDELGVRGIILVNKDDTEAVNIYQRVKRGDIKGCSFGFRIIGEEYEYGSDGEVYSTLTEVDVMEVSICPFPAYPQTSIQARKKDYEVERRRAFELQKEFIRRRYFGT